jgi:hypothetical protein
MLGAQSSSTVPKQTILHLMQFWRLMDTMKQQNRPLASMLSKVLGHLSPKSSGALVHTMDKLMKKMKPKYPQFFKDDLSCDPSTDACHEAKIEL